MDSVKVLILFICLLQPVNLHGGKCCFLA